MDSIQAVNWRGHGTAVAFAPQLTIEQLQAIVYEPVDCFELMCDIQDYLDSEWMANRLGIERDMEEQRLWGWMG